MEVDDDKGEDSVSTDCCKGGKGGRREDGDGTAGLGRGRGRRERADEQFLAKSKVGQIGGTKEGQSEDTGKIAAEEEE
ncbi:hypothetical protein ACLOJK_008049 [Asimina triloba]